MYFPPVFLSADSFDQASLHQSTHQLDSAMVLNLKTLGEVANMRLHAVRRTFNGKYQLMMLGFESRLAGCILTEAQETSDLVPKLCECLVVSSLLGILVNHGKAPKNNNIV